MRPITPALAALVLGACGDQSAPPPVANPPAAAQPSPGGVRPFVGRWAATPGLCATGAWAIDEKRLVTAGEVACEFESVSPTPTGYEIAAICVAEGPPKPYRFTLTMTDPGPPAGLTVSGGPWLGAISLRQCGQGAAGGETPPS